MIENTFEESKCGLVFEVNPIQSGEEICLSTAELPIGIYVVKATDDNGNSLMQKIVVK